jgi:hypothetical protein
MTCRPLRVAWFGGLLVAAVACGTDTRPSEGGVPAEGRWMGPAIGASIAVLANGNVAVVDIDDGSVNIESAETLDVLSRIRVGEEPRALLELPNGRLLVTTHQGGEIVQVDPSAGRALGRVAACAGAFGLAASEDGRQMVASCEWEGTVLSIETESLEVSTLAEGLVRPRPVAIVAGRVLVGEFTHGDVVEISAGRRRSISLVPRGAPYRPALTEMTADLVSAFALAGSRVLVTHQLVNNTGNMTAEPVADDYGSVQGSNAKINPALTTLEPTDAGFDQPQNPVTYAVFGGGTRVFSGPTSVVSLDERAALVVNAATANVAVVDLDEQDPALRAIESFVTGKGASGIAIDRGRKHAYVDEAYDGSVCRLDLTLGRGPEAPIHPAEITRARGFQSRYSDAALAGRKLFHDSSDPHVTPAGVVSCGSCHPEGGEDGLVWFVHTSVIPLKRRRTPDLYSSKTETAPFHWDGQFQTVRDLSQHAVTDLMGGDGDGLDFEAIQAYLDEILVPPKLPVKDSNAVERGRRSFDYRQCEGCHFGTWFTEKELETVLHPMSYESEDVIQKATVPGLRGVFLRAPYFHDGRSPSLEDSLERRDAGVHGGLEIPASERADLLAYVRSL